jgi:hypothetical protein
VKIQGHSHFDSPWAYLACFKDYRSRASWYKAAPELDIAMHQRLHQTKSGRHTLLYFDAPAMIGYQMPSRAQENAHCRREDKPKECDKFSGMDLKLVNVPVSHLKAQKSTIGQYSGRGLFAAQDISKNSILDMDGGVKSFHVLPSTLSTMENLNERVEANNLDHVEDKLAALFTFVEGVCISSFTLFFCACSVP